MRSSNCFLVLLWHIWYGTISYFGIAWFSYQGSLEEGKDTCCVCLRNVGMCLMVHHHPSLNLGLKKLTIYDLANFVTSNVQCNNVDCHATFHPTCARNSGFYMNTKGFGTTLQHKAYCGQHSVEQKEVRCSTTPGDIERWVNCMESHQTCPHVQIGHTPSKNFHQFFKWVMQDHWWAS